MKLIVKNDTNIMKKAGSSSKLINVIFPVYLGTTDLERYLRDMTRTKLRSSRTSGVKSAPLLLWTQYK